MAMMASYTTAESLKAHSSDFALQKYLLLQEQHEAVRQHLEALYSPSLAISGSSNNSFAASPIQLTPSSRSSSGSRARRHRRGSAPWPCQLETVAEDDDVTMTLMSMPGSGSGSGQLAAAAEEQKLFDVNEGIKRTLTELLNSAAVRADPARRTWVQSRLMETEKELRSSRRRRSAAGLD